MTTGLKDINLEELGQAGEYFKLNTVKIMGTTEELYERAKMTDLEYIFDYDNSHLVTEAYFLTQAEADAFEKKLNDNGIHTHQVNTSMEYSVWVRLQEQEVTK